MGQSVLHCFDIDGTIAESTAYQFMYEYKADLPAALMELRAHPNIMNIATQAIASQNSEVMFLTGRGSSVYGTTWRWLNRHLRLSQSGKRVSVVCRPEHVALKAIPQYKLSELVQALRRTKPTELRCYEDNIENLRLFGTVRPMVKTLRLFHCQDGVASSWSL